MPKCPELFGQDCSHGCPKHCYVNDIQSSGDYSQLWIQSRQKDFCLVYFIFGLINLKPKLNLVARNALSEDKQNPLFQVNLE